MSDSQEPESPIPAQSPSERSDKTGLEEKRNNPPSGLTAFWQELKRRHVVRVGMVYAIVGWLIIQVANATFAEFGIPLWAYRFVVLMIALGFPVAIILAWAFELTPEGIKTTKSAQEESETTEDSKAHAKKRNWFSLLFAAGVPTLIFGALAVYFYATRSDSNPSSPDHSSAPLQVTDLDKSIAVLPLDNLSPDPENAFFADGVQEDVLTNLSKVRELLVIGRTSTLQYRDTVKTLPQIAEELDVRYLVEGSVRRAANQVRVTIQLIDSKTGGHLWAENYDRTLDDIFAIQAEIAKEISKQLRAVLSPEELRQIENRPTENQEAYDLFLRARNPEITTRSEMALLMEQAVELDPQFYQAWAELAEYYIQYWNNSSLRQDDERYSKAQLTFENLKRLAPDSPEFL